MGGQKARYVPRNQEIKLFWRDIPGFCWDIPAVPEKFEIKKFVFNSLPLYLTDLHCYRRAQLDHTHTHTQRVLSCFRATQARKKSTKINFLGPETARWGGGPPREGEAVEKFMPSLESLSALGFQERNLGRPGNFAGMSRTPKGQNVCAKEVCVHFSAPSYC